jgi:hypothetical protein
VGREPLSKGANILSAVATEHTVTKVEGNVANRITQSIQKLVYKLHGKGKKRTKSSRKKKATEGDTFP